MTDKAAEIIINGAIMPYEDFMTYHIQMCVCVVLVTLFILWSVKKIVSLAVDLVNIITDKIKTARNRKKRLVFPPSEYTVENIEGDGVIYKNNKEFIIACNCYENALAIKEILIDDELPFT